MVHLKTKVTVYIFNKKRNIYGSATYQGSRLFWISPGGYVAAARYLDLINLLTMCQSYIFGRSRRTRIGEGVKWPWLVHRSESSRWQESATVPKVSRFLVVSGRFRLRLWVPGIWFLPVESCVETWAICSLLYTSTISQILLVHVSFRRFPKYP